MSDTALLLKALHFAAEKHRRQRRKGPDRSPYINHLIAVAELLVRVGRVKDPVVLVAAILHDAIEDTKTRPKEIQKHFGANVRRIVQELTDNKRLGKAKRKQLQVEQARYLSSRAKMVKLADKTCNVLDMTRHPPTRWSHARRLKYLDWSEQVVAGCRGTNAALERCFAAALAAGRRSLAATRA